MSRRQNTTNGNQAPKKASKPAQNYSSKKQQKPQRATQGGFLISRGPVAGTNYSQPTAYAKPKLSGGKGNSSFRVQHKEFVSTVSLLGTGFQPQVIRLRCNPGSGNTFPWLASIANCFERYRFRKLHFLYITRSATTSVGNIVMAPDYDASDAAFTTESQLCNAFGSKETPLYRNEICQLEPGRMNAAYNSHYCMNDFRFSTTAQDAKTLDVASFQLAGDTPSGSIVGKLWVEYDVEFLNPQVNTEPALGNTQFYNVGQLSVNANAVLTQTPQINIGDSGLILDPTLNGLLPNVYPTNVLGTLINDWQGIVTNTWNGTALTTLPSLLANGVTFLNNGNPGIINPTATVGIRNWRTAAQLKKGDIISFANTLLAGSLSGLTTSFASGGFPAFI